MSNFMTRTISGIVMVLLIFLALNTGGPLLACFTLFLSLVGLYEFYNAFKSTEVKPIAYIGYVFAVLLFLNNIGLVNFELSFVFYISLLIALFNLVFNQDKTIEDLAVSLLGLLYVPFLFQHIVYLDGYKYIWLIFIIAWGTDTFAYLAGNLFGKRKLYPKLSPNKTLEGSLGGILGALVLTLVFAKFMGIEKYFLISVLAVLCSILSQLGDLTASRIKRLTGIKDFGKIIPGHGGVLDRFDSILFTAPIIYYFTIILK